MTGKIAGRYPSHLLSLAMARARAILRASQYDLPASDFGRQELERIRKSGISVIIPTKNEEKNIERVILELRRHGFSDILIIDGNSKDKTVSIAKKYEVTVIHQNGNGKGDALRQAFAYDGLKGDVVVMMDADGSMRTEELFSFIETLDLLGVDMVKGSRFIPSGYSEDMTLLRRIGNAFFVFLVNALWFTDYTDLCYGYAVFRRKAIEELYPRLKSKNFEIEAEIFIKTKKSGLSVVELPSVELRRRNGKSNLNAFRDGFRILKTIAREIAHPMD